MSLVSPNPVLASGFSDVTRADEVMTLQGTVRRCWLLVALAVGSAVAAVQVGLGDVFILPAVLAAFVLVMISALRPTFARYSAPAYAVLEGSAVGLLSRWYAHTYGGDLIVYAVGITVSVFVAMLALYATRIVKPTENFRLAVSAATAGVCLYYLAALLVGLAGVRLPLIASHSVYGIGFSVLVTALAAANLVVDFDFIEKGAEQGAPKHMEWFAAQGLLVTLVWLYLEILRLLAKLRDR